REPQNKMIRRSNSLFNKCGLSQVDGSGKTSSFVLALAVLVFRVTVSYHTCSSLKISHPIPADKAMSMSPVNETPPKPPLYGPRRVGSSSSISSMAFTFGAPLTVPTGRART
ncbi:hypothetical protein HID58_057748, partial [Brassica napus]